MLRFGLVRQPRPQLMGGVGAFEQIHSSLCGHLPPAPVGKGQGQESGAGDSRGALNSSYKNVCREVWICAGWSAFLGVLSNSHTDQLHSQLSRAALFNECFPSPAVSSVHVSDLRVCGMLYRGATWHQNGR